MHSETPFYEILYLLIFTPITVPPYFKPQSLLCCFGFPFNCGREGEKAVCGTTRDKWVIYLNTSNLQFKHQQKDAMSSFRLPSLSRKAVEVPQDHSAGAGR